MFEHVVQAGTRGRKKTKGRAIPFKFKISIEDYLRSEAERKGKPMVDIIEEMIAFRMAAQERGGKRWA